MDPPLVSVCVCCAYCVTFPGLCFLKIEQQLPASFPFPSLSYPASLTMLRLLPILSWFLCGRWAGD